MMVSKHICTLAAVVLLALALAGCQARPQTSEDYRFDCFFSEGLSTWSGTMTDSGCAVGSEQRICDAFAGVVKQSHSSRRACLEGCEDVRKVQWQRHIMDGCAHRVSQAHSRCDRYCYGAYPE